MNQTVLLFLVSSDCQREDAVVSAEEAAAAGDKHESAHNVQAPVRSEEAGTENATQ